MKTSRLIACLAVLGLLPVAPLAAKQLKPTDYALNVAADRAEPIDKSKP